MESYVRQSNICEPDVGDVIGFMDGLALTSEFALEPVEQNSMYNGYHSDTMVNKILALYICKKIGNYKMHIGQVFPRSGDAELILAGPISCSQA
jgi:hypothetical protein